MFSGVITAVEGLDSTAVMRPMSVVSTPPPAAYVNAPPMSAYWGQSPAAQAPGAYGQEVLPNVVQGYTPSQLQGAYGVADAIAHGIDGSGQTVAVIDAYSSPTLLSDVETWSQRRGLAFPKVTVHDNAAETDDPPTPAVPSDVPGLGGANLHDPSGWFGEETLDVEAVHAMAPGASILMQSSLTDLNLDFHRAQNKVVSSGGAQIISNSYGGSSDSTDSTSDGYWQQAAAQGIGVYFSSGDAGDQTAGGTDPASRAVDSGGNSPYVTSVGGTTLEVGSRNNRILETYWGTGTANLTNGAWGPTTFQSGGGGGTSEVYAEPDYQRTVVPSRFANYWRGNPNAQSGATLPGRVTPDISMVGDPNSGFLLGLTQDFTAYSNPDGYQLPGDDDHYAEYRIGGTSLSSPLFAGVMALADQAAGKPHGFANPALYRLYRTDAFRDVTAPQSTVAVVRTNYINNTNEADGTQTLLRTAGILGTLSSIPGYDDSTGLGTPNGSSLLSKLAPGKHLG
jgi:subtilase family serine protease